MSPPADAFLLLVLVVLSPGVVPPGPAKEGSSACCAFLKVSAVLDAFGSGAAITPLARVVPPCGLLLLPLLMKPSLGLLMLLLEEGGGSSTTLPVLVSLVVGSPCAATCCSSSAALRASNSTDAAAAGGPCRWCFALDNPEAAVKSHLAALGAMPDCGSTMPGNGSCNRRDWGVSNGQPHEAGRTGTLVYLIRLLM